jgi:hypothetical protein
LIEIAAELMSLADEIIATEAGFESVSPDAWYDCLADEHERLQADLALPFSGRIGSGGSVCGGRTGASLTPSTTSRSCAEVPKDAFPESS